MLADWARSGQSASAFAKSRGLSEKRMRYWSKRLGARGAEPAALSFVPVPLTATTAMGMLELERSGVILRVREDLDVKHVARLVAVLAEAEC